MAKVDPVPPPPEPGFESGLRLRADGMRGDRLLVPIDGSDGSLAAVAEVIRRSREAGRPRVHLLNVQPQVLAAEILAHLPPAASDAYYSRQGGEALSRAQAMLEEAGIPYESHRRVGPIVETILDQCQDLQCDGIVMGTRGRGRVPGALLGSIAAGVVHLSPVPVTLLNAQRRPVTGV